MNLGPERNRELPHQIDLVWVGSRYDVQAKCNCGWRGQPRPPENEDCLKEMLAEYHDHISSWIVAI